MARRRKAAPVDSGPSAEDLHFGRLGILYMLHTEDPAAFAELDKSHDCAEPFADSVLEERARKFAERHRHTWANW